MVAEDKVKVATSKPEAGLYIVATPIGNLKDITLRALETLRGVDAIACEDTRVTNRLLSHYGIKASMVAYNDANGAKVRPQLLRRLAEGQSLALVSDAGTPLISDPGYKLVREAREQGSHITTLPGASSVMGALTLAGLPTNRFLFEGFLPAKQQARTEALRAISNVDATLVFFERASRVPVVLADMLEVLGDREVALVREITKSFEETVHGQLSGLIARYGKGEEIRGEVVLVLAPPSEATQARAGDAVLDERLAVLLREYSVKDVAALAAEEFGIHRKQAYQRALEIKGGHAQR